MRIQSNWFVLAGLFIAAGACGSYNDGGVAGSCQDDYSHEEHQVVTLTLVNNSSAPLWVEDNECVGMFHVEFDDGDDPEASSFSCVGLLEDGYDHQEPGPLDCHDDSVVELAPGVSRSGSWAASRAMARLLDETCVVDHTGSHEGDYRCYQLITPDEGQATVISRISRDCVEGDFGTRVGDCETWEEYSEAFIYPSQAEIVISVEDP